MRQSHNSKYRAQKFVRKRSTLSRRMAGDGIEQEIELAEQPDAADPGPTEARNYTGWVFLWLLFGFLILGGLVATFRAKPDEKKQYTTQELMLRQAVFSNRLADFAPGAGDNGKVFASVAEEVQKDVASSPRAALIYLAANQERGEKPNGAALSTLINSKDPQDLALSSLYASEKLTGGAARRLRESITGDSFLHQLVKVQANEKAGITPSGRDTLAPLWKVFAMVGVVLVFGAISLLGIGLWIVFFSLRKSGKITALGYAGSPITPAQADRMALRASQIVGAFLLFGFIAGQMQRMEANRIVTSLIPPLGVLAFVLLIQKVPVMGRRITLADHGMKRGRLGKDILWGVCAFAAELPLMALLGLLGRQIFSFLPDPEHPASTLLQNRPDFAIVISVLIFGALIAPFWEEVVFRGLMFPAVSKATWGPVAGVLITSWVFAAIHPQGPTTWLALGSIAAVSCVLAYHTKSLVPSVVMHALHNFALLVGTLIIF